MRAEMIAHFMLFMLMMAFTYKMWRCIKLGKINYNSEWASTDDKLHLLDHLVGVLISSIGSTSTAVLLFIEMAAHIVGRPAELHTAIYFALCITFFGVGYLAWHIEKEEDPTHPFYHWKDKNAQYADGMFMRHYLK